MNFKINEVYHGFRLLQETEISEVQSKARIFEHGKSGARLLHLESKDDNKVFSITFRTTPTDSTGVAHILEHSVLCGSRKFTTKDPFGDLAKSSLNTFLNAITFTDKTMYPVSSRNHRDFMNLMDVYLDCVLYPNIYKNHETLRQEGWRHEIDLETNKLIYNGVVYSEMQGALSSPEEVICGEIYRSLFPNTTYAFNSGGDPEVIPDLTQEQFEEFHSKYYHPSNSYIYLYGDQDLEECLKFINDNYLINFDRIEIPSHIDDVEPHKNIVETVSQYSISEEEDEENKTFLALSFACEETSKPEEYLAMKILYDMFIKSSASPIKTALLKAGIGESIITADDMNMDATKKSIFPIVVKNADASKKEEFKKVIFDTLKALVKNGIDKDTIEASINSIEFELREADPWKIANKGIYYSYGIMESWLYEGNPVAHIKYEENLNKIKASIDNKYFENFIEKYMINNTHASLVILNPKKGLEDIKEKDLEEKLQNYKNSLSTEQLEELNKRNEKLKASQVRIDTIEDKNTIPKLPIEEICKKAEGIPQVVKNEQGVTILSHEIYTGKISYINLLFDAKVIEEENVYYLALLKNVLGELDTEKYEYSKLVTEIYKKTGGITFENEVFTKQDNVEAYETKFIVKSKVLTDSIPTLMELINEIITLTKFDNTKRIKEVIQEAKSKLQMRIVNEGDRIATIRAYSNFSKADKYKDMINGASYYEFLCDLEKNYENKCKEVKLNLKKVSEKIFNINNLMLSFVGEKEDLEKVTSNLNSVLNNLSKEKIDNAKTDSPLKKEIEGLVTASSVQYVAKAFNFNKVGYKYSGNMRVMQNIVDSEYLHTRVRLQGGAYECYSDMSKDGNIAFESYRDPNLAQTIKVYDEAYKFVENIDYSKEDMEKFIIGSIGKLDQPLTPEKKGESAVQNYICGITYEAIQKERDELLNTTIADVKAYSEMIKAGMEQNYCCVAGNEAKIKENKDIFDKITMLL